MNLHCAQGNCYTETFFMERRNLKFRNRTRKGSSFTDSKERGLFVYIYWFLFFCTIILIIIKKNNGKTFAILFIQFSWISNETILFLY